MTHSRTRPRRFWKILALFLLFLFGFGLALLEKLERRKAEHLAVRELLSQSGHHAPPPGP